MSIQCPMTLTSTANFDAYMAYVNSLPALSVEQEQQLFKAYQNEDDLNAVQQIILSHLRFVVFIAKDFKGYGLPIEDLVQEGTIGLMKSVKKFSLDFGVRLSSFAVHYIKAEIHEFVIRNWRLVKATTTKAKRKLFFNLRRLKSKTGWLPVSDKQKIANQLGVSESDIAEMEVQLAQSDIYIESSTDNGEHDNHSINTGLLLEDKSEHFVSTLINEDFNQKAISKINVLIDSLDGRSKDILKHRWLSEEKMSHKYFADKYGVSQERIRQIEQKALFSLRQGVDELIV